MKLIIFLITNILLYFIFSFITMEMNPLHWSIMTTIMGRIVLCVIEFCIIRALIEEW